jgi:hypothetical protein
MAAPWGNTKITGTSAAGPTTGNDQQSISAIVRAQGGLYENAFSISDPFAFAAKAAEKLDALKKSSTLRQGMTDFEYMQALLRSSGKSKGTGPLGSTDNKDISAFKTVLQNAYLDGVTWNQWLENDIKFGAKPEGPKAPSFNPIYSKDISTALKLIDSTDAENILSDTYFKAFSEYPSVDLISKFKSSYSKEATRQKATVTSESVVKYVPVLNSKGKATYNKDGTPVMKAVKTSTESTTGQGFTEEEQQDFLAQYIVDNSPKGAFDAATIAGAAKTYYDLLSQSHSLNYEDAPNIATLTPIIKTLLAATDQGVIDETVKKYQTDVRTRVGTKFMGVSEYVKSGGDARTIVDPLLKSLSANLETDINQNDKLAIKLLNFQGADGKFRLPNQYEIDQAVMSDSRFGATSTAKNEAVNLFQSLKGALA